MTACNCPGCRGSKPHPTPPTEQYLDAFNAETRRILGKPALPVMDNLPAELRAFVGGL